MTVCGCDVTIFTDKIDAIYGSMVMLQILDEKVMKTDSEIENLYRNCKYLCIIDSYDKLADNNRGAIGVQYEFEG